MNSNYWNKQILETKGTYSINVDIFKKVYENVANIQAVEIFIKIDELNFYVQAYNTYSTYLYNARIEKNHFNEYIHTADSLIKFKFISTILKEFTGVITIVLNTATIIISDLNTRLEIDYIKPDEDEYIPRLEINTSCNQLAISKDIDLYKEMSTLVDKVTTNINLNLQNDKLICTVYSPLTNIKKIRTIHMVHEQELFDIDLNFTSNFKLIISTLKNSDYIVKFYKSENVVEFIHEKYNIEYIIMGECLMTI